MRVRTKRPVGLARTHTCTWDRERRHPDMHASEQACWQGKMGHTQNRNMGRNPSAKSTSTSIDPQHNAGSAAGPVGVRYVCMLAGVAASAFVCHERPRSCTGVQLDHAQARPECGPTMCARAS